MTIKQLMQAIDIDRIYSINAEKCTIAKLKKFL